MNTSSNSLPKFHPVVRGNWLNGKFILPIDPNGEWIVRSPADLNDQIGRFTYSYRMVDDAVHCARGAFAPWSRKSNAERVEIIKNFHQMIAVRREEFAEIIAREVGKPLWDAQAEVRAALQEIDVALHESFKPISDFEIPEVIENAKGVCRYKPLGVLAVVGPFSSPLYFTSAQFIPALLTGNTVVFKPSEKAPMAGQLIAECFEEAGIPAGVFNLIQGEREVGRRLCVHEGVDGVLFAGSNETGVRIKQDTLQQHWKFLTLQMGGKNPVMVWEDADLEAALMGSLVGAFTSAGQRCTSTSRILVHRKIFDLFLNRFHERAKAFSIGHPLENPFMGPLIDSSSVDRYMKFLGIASREGCEIVMRGKALDLGYSGHYVAPSICCIKQPTVEAVRKSIYQQTELFGPNVVLIPVEDLDEAIALSNASQYGLVTSVYSKNRTVYEKCLDQLQYGLIYWNQPTIEASPRLPFGGLKKSGNHVPGAVFSALSCTTPVASLEAGEASSVSRLSCPGLNWK